MLGTTLFVLCATALAHADDSDLDGFFENGCPKDTSIHKVLPHEDCQQYYHCFNGALIARYCPNGLHFSATLEKCDWIGKADCHKKSARAPSSDELNKSDPRQVDLICSSSDSDGVLVAHKNCNQFYKCLDGGKVVLNCAKGLLYNTVAETCDWPQNVKCRSRTKDLDEKSTIRTTTYKVYKVSYSIEDIDQSNADPSQAIAQCSSKRSDGVLVAHENCNMFYKCSGGVPITMRCPSTLLYNPIKELCDWPANVDCDDRSIPESIENNRNAPTADKNNEDTDDFESAASDTCAAESSDGVLAAHERCNHFYKCSGGKPVPFSCPGDLLFNSKKSYCDWPKKVECGERIENEVANSDFKTEDPKQAHEICSTEESDGVLVAHESCNKFYKCHDGLPVAIQCPGNLLYNIKEEICDWPTHVYCSDRIVADDVRTLKEDDENNDNSRLEKVNKKSIKKLYPKQNKEKDVSGYNYHTDSSNVAETCTDESYDGKFLPHENCNQFYKCSENKPVPFFCPLNLVYNVQKMFCDWPSNVICGNRILPRNINDDKKNKHGHSPCRGKLDGAILPHENCSQFYKCTNGQKYPLDCPPGLYFNSLLIVCDWPMNVDCGDRLTEAQLKNEAL